MRAALLLLLSVVLASTPASAHKDWRGEIHPQVTAEGDGFLVCFVDNVADGYFRVLTDRQGTVLGKRKRVKTCPAFYSGRLELRSMFPSRAEELKSAEDVLPIDAGHRYVAAGGNDGSLNLWLFNKDDEKPAHRVTVGPSARIRSLLVSSNLLLHQGSVLIAWVTPEGDLRLASWNPDAPSEAMRTDTLATGLSKNNTVTIALNGDDLVVAWHDFDPAKHRSTIRTAHRRLPLAK